MANKYVHIKNFCTQEEISLILDKSKLKTEKDSLLGSGKTRVNPEKKIRKDVFFSISESKNIDEFFFDRVENIVKNEFNLKLEYRDTYKIGRYYGDQGGFYIPHTDTQGGVEFRKISIIMCLSKIEDYSGGIFKFIDLDKSFKFDIGDIVIFDSRLLHGVNPVTDGLREVLISFMWDEEGEKIRLTKSYAKPNTNYMPHSKLDKNPSCV